MSQVNNLAEQDYAANGVWMRFIHDSRLDSKLPN